MSNVYTTAKTTIDGKTYKGAAIGFGSKIDNEKKAIKNLLLKIPEFKYFWSK